MIETYTSLHNHTDYSNASCGFSDSINTVAKLIQRAYDIGLSGVAITDHECISGYIQAINYHKKMQKDRPFNLILGNEIYLLSEQEYINNKENAGKTQYYHFILLALDTDGYHQICELTTRAWNRAWVSGVYRRPTLYEDLEEIIEPNKGHVIGLTACLGSRIDNLLLNNNIEEADKEIDRLVKIFGKENFYIECQPAKDKNTDQSVVNNLLYQTAVYHDIPIVVTTDSHYLKKEDSLIHKVFLNSQDGDREVEDFYATAYMMDCQELRDNLRIDFDDETIDNIFSNTNEIGNRVKDYNIFHNPIIPQLPIEKIPNFEIKHTFKEYYNDFPNFAYYSNHTEIHERYFFYQIEQGLISKVVEKGKDLRLYLDRLDKEWNELKKISEALGNSMVSYYSTMAELVDIMWDIGSFVGAGRGSAAGFLTTYILDITSIDPVPFGETFPFWRHLALERGAEIAD